MVKLLVKLVAGLELLHRVKARLGRQFETTVKRMVKFDGRNLSACRSVAALVPRPGLRLLRACSTSALGAAAPHPPSCTSQILFKYWSNTGQILIKYLRLLNGCPATKRLLDKCWSSADQIPV
jgi:hypothetical protein